MNLTNRTTTELTCAQASLKKVCLWLARIELGSTSSACSGTYCALAPRTLTGRPRLSGTCGGLLSRGTYNALCTVAEMLRPMQSTVKYVKSGRNRCRHCNRKIAVRSARQVTLIDWPPLQVTELHFVCDVRHDQQVSLIRHARHPSKW